jgi:UDPglucose 6-dehydrogenase
MKLCIIGSGYVGLVSGACFAEVGHTVTCVDNNEKKVQQLLAGKVPIYEPGLEELIHRNVAAKRLHFTTSTEEGVDNSDVVFIAVPTPPQADGSVDLSYIEKVAREIAAVLKQGQYRVIVDKSTVPVKTGEKVADTIRRYNKTGAEFDVVSNPEFLREGCAVPDLMKPDRIVIGGNSERAVALMQKIYEPFMAPVLVTDINSAELIKHAANSFLALKISYINAVARICEASGADVEKVADGIGMDRRIGRNFLNAGIGYGGSCFPKDIAAFIAISEDLGVPFTLLKEVEKINFSQRERFLDKIREALWVLKDKKIAVWDSPSNQTPTMCAPLWRSMSCATWSQREPKSRSTIQKAPKKPLSSNLSTEPAWRIHRSKPLREPRHSLSPPSGRNSPRSISPSSARSCTRRSSSTDAISLLLRPFAPLASAIPASAAARKIRL